MDVKKTRANGVRLTNSKKTNLRSAKRILVLSLGIIKKDIKAKGINIPSCLPKNIMG